MTTHHTNTNTHTASLSKAVRIVMFIGVIWAVCHAGVSAVQADQIKLSPRANMPAGEVKLKDIAELQGPAALALGNIVLGELKGDSLTIAMADVRQKLDEQGVNWGLLSLRGFMKCQVNSSQPTTSLKPAEVVNASVEAEADADGNAVANPAVYVASHSMLTVGDRVTALLVERTRLPADELRIHFAARDQPSLALGILKDRWEVEPSNSAKLGRVLVTVRQWQGERIANTYRLTADVTHRALCVVAKRNVQRNEMFTPADLEIQEVYLQDEFAEPARKLTEVIGKVASQPVNKGNLVMADQIARPDLIKRGDRLVVRCIVGGMVIKTTARAMESGAMGDDIIVANLDSNERFTVRITGSKEAIVSTKKQDQAQTTQAPASTPAAASGHRSVSPVPSASARESRS